MTELKKRVSTAIVGIILLITILRLGGIYLNVSIGAISAIALFELYNALKKIDININLPILLLSQLALLFLNSAESKLLIAILIMILSFCFEIFGKREINTVVFTVFSYIYISINFSLLNEMDKTPYLALVFIISFSTDTFAYFVGSKFGKNKLIESVSPNKSVEGSIGGILGCILVSALYCYFIGIKISLKLVLLILIASIVAQIGDLSASLIKRETKIKDFGKILPGHGGILDRFDSTLMVIPVVYFIFAYNIGG